jgi:putative transposase
MAQDDGGGRRQDRWAQLRFAVVGALLAAPPKKGELQQALAALAARAWQHPIRQEPVRFARSTLERWYYQARRAPIDPVGELRRRMRADAGQQPAMGEPVRAALRAQYLAHPSWSYQLHVDNLRVLVARDPGLGPMPSYATVRRYMQAQGLVRQRAAPPAIGPALRASTRRSNRAKCAAMRSNMSAASGTPTSITAASRS